MRLLGFPKTKKHSSERSLGHWCPKGSFGCCLEKGHEAKLEKPCPCQTAKTISWDKPRLWPKKSTSKRKSSPRPRSCGGNKAHSRLQKLPVEAVPQPQLELLFQFRRRRRPPPPVALRQGFEVGGGPTLPFTPPCPARCPYRQAVLWVEGRANPNPGERDIPRACSAGGRQKNKCMSAVCGWAELLAVTLALERDRPHCF